MSKEQAITAAYKAAQNYYAEFGVNTETALQKIRGIKISLNCWQGDDVGGFETDASALSGGIQVTGNYPGKARTIEELQQDLLQALSFIPGNHRLNLHAIYGDFGGKPVARNELEYKYFQPWVEWAKAINLDGIDFNPTFFSHPLAADGFTLSHRDSKIREFWIEHGIRCRKISAAIGKELNSPCVNNIWIPDGYKDTPIDRNTPRELLRHSLDLILKQRIPKKYNLDAVESKLFGIGSESYVTGSHEFYLGYAINKNIMLCLDSGHFHPTESIADKLSAVLLYIDEILLHVSRGVRWDSDHVVTLSDETKAIAQELVRNDLLQRVHIGLDFFDATINRVAAWAIGANAVLQALLIAMLEPIDLLRKLEVDGNFTARLACQEFIKTMPFGAIWDYYCLTENVPPKITWLQELKKYEETELSKRV